MGPLLEFDSWFTIAGPFLLAVLVVAMLMFCIIAFRLTGVLASTQRCAAQVQTLRIHLKLKKSYQINKDMSIMNNKMLFSACHK